MKAKPTISILLLLALMTATLQTMGQTPTQASFNYKELITDNPNPERDVQIVSAYVNAIVAGELDKARELMASNFKTSGPGPMDSADREKELNNWQERYKIQTNRKTNFIWQTFRVVSGDLKGNWVSVWGDYNCTMNGKNIRVPFHNVCHLTDDGKIDREISYWDNLAVYQALGYTLVPPKQPKKMNKVAAR
ncbi:Ketosteroid isomerase-related protein [Cnuella takakiae]|uniref:Ketosteroid isomerase-related protein n=1 Tax=Cnuella takakiae TaxID=1302690 RepID=A0A1M4T0R9_9BACT|nr:hypothetical protein [Cnuella takakiae]SHE38091.1 Ketosteroid isomerase-related protein [Cnuella takakiae]